MSPMCFKLLQGKSYTVVRESRRNRRVHARKEVDHLDHLVLQYDSAALLAARQGSLSSHKAAIKLSIKRRTY